MISSKLHWLAQRVSAVVLIPLIIWFIYFYLKIFNLPYDEILYFFKSPINSLLFLLTILSMIYHGYLGMIIIVEDYINSLNLRKMIFIFINCLSIALITILIISLLTIQISV